VTTRLRLSILLSIVTLLTAAPAAFSLLTIRPDPIVGKRLYREFCGQCHALEPALAVGFGSNNGLGQDGGPSFDTLSVPFNLSIVAVTGQIGGHEHIAKRLNWKQLNQVAAYVALVTRKHPIVANVTDG